MIPLLRFYCHLLLSDIRREKLIKRVISQYPETISPDFANKFCCGIGKPFFIVGPLPNIFPSHVSFLVWILSMTSQALFFPPLLYRPYSTLLNEGLGDYPLSALLVFFFIQLKRNLPQQEDCLALSGLAIVWWWCNGQDPRWLAATKLVMSFCPHMAQQSAFNAITLKLKLSIQRQLWGKHSPANKAPAKHENEGSLAFSMVSSSYAHGCVGMKQGILM